MPGPNEKQALADAIAHLQRLDDLMGKRSGIPHSQQEAIRFIEESYLSGEDPLGGPLVAPDVIAALKGKKKPGPNRGKYWLRNYQIVNTMQMLVQNHPGLHPTRNDGTEIPSAASIVAEALKILYRARALKILNRSKFSEQQTKPSEQQINRIYGQSRRHK